MKFLTLVLFLCSNTFAAPPWTYRLNTASTNLTATFPANPQIVGPASAISNIDVSNGAASEIEINCSESTTPSSLASDSIFIPASLQYSSPLNPLVPYPFLKACFLRSVSGTISSGVIEVVVWGY